MEGPDILRCDPARVLEHVFARYLCRGDESLVNWHPADRAHEIQMALRVAEEAANAFAVRQEQVRLEATQLGTRRPAEREGSAGADAYGWDVP